MSDANTSTGANTDTTANTPSDYSLSTEVSSIAKLLAELLPMDHARALEVLDTTHITHIHGMIDRIAEFATGRFNGQLGVEYAEKMLKMKHETLDPVVKVLGEIQETLTEAKAGDELKRPRNPRLTTRIEKLGPNYIYALKELKDFVTGVRMLTESTTSKMQEAVANAETYKLSPEQKAEYESLIEYLPKIHTTIDEALGGFAMRAGLSHNSLLQYFDKLKATPATVVQK